MQLKAEDVAKIIKENESEIRKFGVKEIYLFGSVVRGEAKSTSDIDFLVTFEKSTRVGFFKLFELQKFLEAKLSVSVDLGTKLHPLLKDQIMSEALRVA